MVPHARLADVAAANNRANSWCAEEVAVADEVSGEGGVAPAGAPELVQGGDRVGVGLLDPEVALLVPESDVPTSASSSPATLRPRCCWRS